MLLALDVAFRNTGWSVLDRGKLIAWGTIVTKPEKNKKVRVSDAYASECAHFSSQLINLIKTYKPKGIIGELPNGSQSAKSAKLLGGAVATVTAIATGFNLPLEWISEGDSKNFTFGRRTGTKEEAMDWARAQYPEADFGTVKSKFEHVADALLAYNGLQNGLLVRTFG